MALILSEEEGRGGEVHWTGRLEKQGVSRMSGYKRHPQSEGLSNGPGVLKGWAAQGREDGERAEQSLLPCHDTSTFRDLRSEAMVYNQDRWGVVGSLSETSVGYPTRL